jgi:NAD(P)-dependent dehydrogenase (short-subunit alcohol dehydrogenase family)
MNESSSSVVDVDLTGQVAVITGGGRGIGVKIAASLALAGARVIVAGRRRADLERTAAEIHSMGGETLPMAVDVTQKDQVEKLRTAIAARGGGIDLLVNNAGILGKPGRWWQQATDDWWRVLEVNLKGTMLLTQTFLPGMLARGKGRIINLGSNAGLKPVFGLGPYAVSKAALLRLTDSLSTDLEGTGVTVFAVSPGLVKTDLSRTLPSYDKIPKELWLPAGRVAQLCLTIAGGRADRLTGRYLHAGEDMDAIIGNADLIVEQDWYAMRLREANPS